MKLLKQAVEKKDMYLIQHQANVKEYAKKIANIMCPQLLTDIIATAADFHDIGKVCIPDQALRKSGPLTPEEWIIMKQHPVIGSEMLILQDKLGHNTSFGKDLMEIVNIIRCHHEMFNGMGYPDGLKGQDIPLGARIVAVADAYDAMTTDRPYRKALPAQDAIKAITNNSGLQFDPEVVRAFIILTTPHE